MSNHKMVGPSSKSIFLLNSTIQREDIIVCELHLKVIPMQKLVITHQTLALFKLNRLSVIAIISIKVETVCIKRN